MKNVFLCLSQPSWLFVTWIASSGLPAQEQQTAPLFELERLDRDTLIRAVVERNPSIDSARLAWAVAREREPQLTSLGDPSISYGFAPLSIATAEARFGQTIGFAQRLPYPGKLGLRGEIARFEADAAGHDYAAVRLRLATVASLLFDDYYFVARATEINTEHMRLLESFKRIATARYAVGLAAQQDPLQAEVEVAHLLHREVVLRTSQKAIVAQLNALLHRPPDTRLPPPPATLPMPPPTDPTDAVAQESDSDAGRPELNAQLARIQAREATVRLRRKDFYPDFEASTAFNSMWGNAEHRWTAGITIHMPVRRDRLRAASAEAAAALEQAHSERSALEDTIRMEVYVAREKLLEVAHVLELYRSRLLPASTDQIRAARAGFETGQNNFLALIEAQRGQRSVELGFEEALTNFYRRRAELDRALGIIPAVGVHQRIEGGAQ